MSRGGKAVIALPSTAKAGSVSRIVTHLSEGAGVVTTRAGVTMCHRVTASLSPWQEHPGTRPGADQRRASKFRADLLRQGSKPSTFPPELADKEGKIKVGPKELRTTHLVSDGTLLNFRPIHPTDEPRMRDLFYKLSEATIYYRFMGYQKRVSRQQLQDFVYIDHRNDVTIVGTMPEAHGEDIIAVGSYYLDQKTNLAEVAFTVSDPWQNKGIGTSF